MTTRVRGPACSALAWIVLVLCATAPACLTPGQARSLQAQVREIGRQVDRLSAEQARVLDGLRSLEPAAAARVLIGRSLLARGQCREAIAELGRALQNAPAAEPAAQALYAIALCHLRLGETSQAREALREIVGSYPTTDVAPLALTRLEGL